MGGAAGPARPQESVFTFRAVRAKRHIMRPFERHKTSGGVSGAGAVSRVMGLSKYHAGRDRQHIFLAHIYGLYMAYSKR